MYILIFEPQQGCNCQFLDSKYVNINIGKLPRDGYKNIFLKSDFAPDYACLMMFKNNEVYLGNYGKVKIIVDGVETASQSKTVLKHGSMIEISKGEKKNICIACVDNKNYGNWKIYKNNGILDISIDKRGYVVNNAKGLIFRGNKINANKFFPKSGNVFIYDKYVFFHNGRELFYDELEEAKKTQPVPPQPPKPVPPKPVPPQPPKPVPPQPIPPQPPKPVPPQPIPKPPSNKSVTILMENVNKFDRKSNVYRLKNVNLKVHAGRLVAIMGVSGAGKSTLFSALLGILKPDSGNIQIAKREFIGYVPQKTELRLDISVQDTMEYYASRKLKKLNKRDRQNKIDEILSKLNLAFTKQRLVGNISGGQLRRLDVAVQLLNEPRIILMDEPDSGLDIQSCIELYKILAKLVQDNDSTILVITHNTHMTCKYPYIDDLLFLASQGRICFYGEKNDSLSYFNINDIDEIYTVVENDQDFFVDKYNKLINGGI